MIGGRPGDEDDGNYDDAAMRCFGPPFYLLLLLLALFNDALSLLFVQIEES